MSSALQLLKAAVRNPTQISTLWQTSPFTVRKLLSPLKTDGYCRVLELGAGAGALTYVINKIIKNKSNYIGIEINESLFQFLTKSYPELKFYSGSAEAIDEFCNHQKFDLIVSTLPWSILDSTTQENILVQIKAHLEKGGYFKSYLFISALFLKGGREFQKKLHDKFYVETSYEVLNFPPVRIFECRLK